jgi:hypothetical protein
MVKKIKREALGVKLTIRKSNMIPPQGFSAINLYPFAIYTRGRVDRLSDKTLRHEAIHTLQARTLLIIPYYLWYLIEWLIKSIIVLFIGNKGISNFAYKSISFEQEAFYNDNNLNYGNERKWLGWMKYIFSMYKV